MAFEYTMTEQDMDAQSQQFVQGLRACSESEKPDPQVDCHWTIVSRCGK